MTNLLQYSFKELEKAFITKEFYTLFFNQLQKELTKYYGKAESLELLELINSKKIKVINPTLFFDDNVSLLDNSLRISSESAKIPEFFMTLAKKYKNLLAVGATKVEFSALFAILYSIFCRYRMTASFDKELKNFFLYLSMIEGTKTRATIYIPDLYIMEFLCNKTGISLVPAKYIKLAKKIVRAYKTFLKNPAHKGAVLPNIKVVHAIFKDERTQVLFYLSDLFGLTANIVNKATKNILTLTKDTAELRAALNYLKSLKGEFFTINEDEVVQEVVRIAKSRPYNSYPIAHTDRELFLGAESSLKTALTSFEQKYVALDTCESMVTPIHSEIEVNCARTLDVEGILQLISSAVKIGMVKERFNKNSSAKLLITLTKVGFVSDELIDRVKNHQFNLKSTLNIDFLISMEFKKEFAESKFTRTKPTHIRVISDIHWDINRGKGYTFDFGEDFVINCGDTASRYDIAADWTTANVRRGVIIPGNHLGYEYPYEDCPPSDFKNTKDFQITKLTQAIGTNPDIKVIGAISKPFKIAPKIMLVGSTLYSDLMLFGEKHFEEARALAGKSINDFRRCHIAESLTKRTTKPFTIDDHIEKFKRELKALDKKIAAIHNYPVIVVTHFAPLPYSVAEEYKNDLLTAYFVNDLTDFLNKHSCIRLWCHGHTHAKFDYIYRRKKPSRNGDWCETRVVCNPFGYYNENNAELPYQGTIISMEEIRSFRLWTSLKKEEIQKGEITVYENRKDIWRENYNKKHGIVDQS